MVQKLIAFLRSPSLVYLGAAAIGRLGSMFLIPLYTRMLSREEFATVSLAGTLQSLLALLLAGGLTAGLSKVFFDTPKDESPEGRVGVIARGIVGLVLGLGLALTALIMLVWPTAGLGGFTSYQLVLVVCSGGGAAINSIPDVWYRSKRLAWWSASINTLSFVLNVGLAYLFVVHYRRGLNGVLEASATSFAVVALWGLVFTFVYLRPSPGQPTPNVSILTTLRFAFPFVPHFLASWVFSVGDRWALMSIGQRETLGLYSIGQQLSSPLPMVASAVNEVEVTVMGQAFRDGGVGGLDVQLKRGLRRYLMLTGVPYLGLLLLIPVLHFVLGPNFQQGLWLLPFVGLAAVIDAAYYPPVNVLFFASHTRWIPIVTVTAAVVSIAAAAGLTSLFGVVGLVAARLISSMARVAFCVLLAKRAIRGGVA